MYDAIIVGAGPAGATTARLLAGWNCLLVDSRRFGPPDGREKCCGGLLAPDARSWLDRMGLCLPPSVLETAQPMGVRALDLATGLSRLYPRPYTNLNRLSFERWLLSLLPANVSFREECRCVGLSPLRDGPGWEVALRDANGASIERARCVVGADGAGGAVRRLLGAPPRPAIRYLAVQDCFPRASEPDGENEYAAFFHPGITDFYGWLIPKRDRLLLGVALPLRGGAGQGVPKLMDRARTALEERGYAFPGVPERQASLLLRPGPGDVFPGRDGAWCVGEAAGFISPSSAEGYSYAFASAAALSDALLKRREVAAQLRAYRRNIRGLKVNLAWKQLKSAIMFSPRLRALTMKSGLLSSG